MNGGHPTIEIVTQLTYILAAGLFVLSLKWLSKPATARRGVIAGVLGMTAAIVGTLLHPEIVSYKWILIAMVVGTVIGIPLSWVPMTAVPQRTALSHAFGGLAAGLVGTAKFYLWQADGSLTAFRTSVIVIEVILGYLTFTGSLMAAASSRRCCPTRPITYRGQNIVNLALLAAAVVAGVVLAVDPSHAYLFPLIIVLSLSFGVLLILPIGGADMPTVISLLNSYAGLAAVAMGFVLDNKLLIIAGALDGSSGLILSIIMCRAMNRSFTNVLFGAFGTVQASAVAASQKAVKIGDRRGRGAASRERQPRGDRARLRHGRGAGPAPGARALRPAHQARRGRALRHPPGGRPHAGAHERAPGRGRHPLRPAGGDGRHQPRLPGGRRRPGRRRQRRGQSRGQAQTPAARSTACRSSTSYKARTVLVIKRSMNPGFAGIDNELYNLDQTLMVFGDAKSVIGDIVKVLSGEGGGLGH